jgi:hypothetical protein
MCMGAIQKLPWLLQVCLLDYVRFLVGSMWGACTPESFVQKAGMLNQGMHKRDIGHHMHMVRRTLSLLAAEKRSGSLKAVEQ